MAEVVSLPERELPIDESEILEARNWQDLLDASAEVFEVYRIDHAALLCSQMSYLALLPVTGRVKSESDRIVRLGVHPAMRAERLNQASKLAQIVTEPAGERFMAAFRSSGMEDVYELPLKETNTRRVVFEVARSGASIKHRELMELQAIARIIYDRLPELLHMPGFLHSDAADDADEYIYSVR